MITVRQASVEARAHRRRSFLERKRRATAKAEGAKVVVRHDTDVLPVYVPISFGRASVPRAGQVLDGSVRTGSRRDHRPTPPPTVLIGRVISSATGTLVAVHKLPDGRIIRGRKNFKRLMEAIRTRKGTNDEPS